MRPTNSNYGIVIGWVPGSDRQAVQVARSSDDGTGSPNAATETVIATVLADRTYYYDVLPVDNALRHYRVRHIGTGLTNGTYSAYVRAKPASVPGNFTNTIGDQTFSESSALPTTYTVGDLLYASAAAVLSKRAAVATGNLLISQGATTAPTWGKLASTHLSGDYTFPGSLTITGTLSGVTTLTATAVGGTLSTAAQANVTSLGTLAANLLFVDATYDIGASGATRPRDFFMSRNATIGGTATVAGLLTAEAGLTVNTAAATVFRNDTALSDIFTVQQSGTGDASMRFRLTGVVSWEMGIDNSDADNFKISKGNSSGVGTNDALVFDSSMNAAFRQAVSAVGAISGDATLQIDGNTLLGTTVPATGSPRLDVVGDPALVLSHTVVDATEKVGRLAGRHYTNAEEPLAIFSSISNASVAAIHVGGGTSIFNAATSIIFYTAATTTTTTGTVTFTVANTVITPTVLLTTLASASGGAGLRLPHGAAPSSPTDGDMWTTTAGLYVRINGGTVGPLT